jgi:hypothetical protein
VHRGYVIDSTYFFNKAILCPGSNDVDHIREEVLTVLTDRLKPIQLHTLCFAEVKKGISLESFKSYIPVYLLLLSRRLLTHHSQSIILFLNAF